MDEMFFYAGGSIRMMQWPVEDVITFLTHKIRFVPDMRKLVGAEGFGDSSQMP